MSNNIKRQKNMGHGPSMRAMPVEKAKNFKSTSVRLIEYLQPQKFKIITVFIFAILSTIFSIFSPKIMGKATTKLYEGIMAKAVYFKSVKSGTAPGIDFISIKNILLFLIFLYVLSAFFSYIQQYIMASVAQKTVLKMRNDVDNKLSKLPLKYFDSRTYGEILSRVTNDIDTVANTLQQSLTQLITSVVTIIGIIIMMLTISPLLTLVTLITLPLSVMVTTFIAKHSQKYFAEQQKDIGELNGYVEEMYTGHKIIKVFNREEKCIKKFKDINDKLYTVGWKAQFISGIIMPMLNFINNIGYVIICVIGGILVTKRSIELGDIQAFIQYSKQFGQPIVQTANIFNILQSTVAAAERVFEILDEEEELDIERNTIISNPKGEVIFKNVKFGYKENETLIDDMNIHVKPGQTIAIVGPTGAGKTTIVNLLMRFYEIQSGKISIDGINIKNLRREDLHRMIGMVLQDTWLFSGSIKNNIAYGNKDASELDIIKAAKLAHIDHFIRTLPNGYDTVLNEDASNVSQGEKQLLTIARALLADPTILILDEATSSVDTRTEIQIQKAMVNLMKGRTSFVIAHRLSTIKDADSILVMNHGKVIEQGTHNELLIKNGFYADLYNSQFKNGSYIEE